jgi:hypothetical protein
MSLGEEFPEQQRRCRKLLTVYKALGPVGSFGALMIEQTLQRADQAAISGDLVEMLRSFNELREMK